MRKRFTLAAVLLSAIFVGAGLLNPAPASALRLQAPRLQAPIYTPTPGPDGRIIWVVQPNDTLLRISLISGVPVETLRGLNNLTADTIFPGQKLLLGLAGPPEVTPTFGPTPTPTPVLPTPTPKPGSGNLCAILFNDLNGDSIRQEAEPSIPAGAINLNNRSGSVSETVETGAGLDPHCFNDLPEGEYTLSVAAPGGYNPTTVTSLILQLGAGEVSYVNFGAQANSSTLAEAPVLPSEGRRSPMLGILGGLFLVGGVILALLAARLIKSR